MKRGYYVTTMATITTKLVKDGNSMAVRLPKTILAMSGLSDTVRLEAKRGQIVLRAAKQARSGWEKQIAQVVATNVSVNDEELADWDAVSGDGLD